MKNTVPRWFGLTVVVVIVSVAIALFTLPLQAKQLSQATPPAQGVVKSSSNLRDGPGTNYAIIGHASPGEVVGIFDCNEACDWYQLDSGPWIAAFLVLAIDDSDDSTATGTANLRGGPGTDWPIVGGVTGGQALSIIGRDRNTGRAMWYQLATGQWIASFLVKNGPGTGVPIVCDNSYPSVCIVSPPPDLDCGQIPYGKFTVQQPDPHRFDGDSDGVGCEGAPPTTVPPTTVPPTTVPPTTVPPVCDCSGNLYNCANFSTHAQAQACFNYCKSQGRGDIHRLDGDNDGSACEALP